MNINQENYRGQRFSFSSRLCTVLFVGSVRGASGQWLGVQWDDPLRGKHSGVYLGEKYFESLGDIPHAGSFVRPNRPSDEPRSFKEAVQEKYASDYYEHKAALEAGIEDRDTAIWISGKEVEEVGFEKIRQQLANLQELKVVILDEMRINRPQARAKFAGRITEREEYKYDDDVAKTCPKVYELDLSRNLFEEGDEILDIIRQLPALTSLKISGNRLRSTASNIADERLKNRPFTSLEELIVDDTLLRWRQIANFALHFKALKYLSAAGNVLDILTFESFPDTLTTLNLERNWIQSLTSLRFLAPLSNLKHLILKENKISQLKASHENKEQLPQFSSNLSNVDLSFNSIADWRLIDTLPLVFPGLRALRTSHNPLYQNLKSAQGNLLTEGDGYMLTIARIDQLETLNFSTVTRKERINSETYYLSQIAYTLSNSAPSTWPEIQNQHPRYTELCQKYGEPAVKLKDPAALNPESLAARLVSLSVRPGPSLLREWSSADKFTPSQAIKTEIPLDYSVQSVLGILGRRFNLTSMVLRLVLEREDGSEEAMTPRTRPLRSWVDGNSASVRLEFSNADAERSKAAREVIQARLLK